MKREYIVTTITSHTISVRLPVIGLSAFDVLINLPQHLTNITFVGNDKSAGVDVDGNRFEVDVIPTELNVLTERIES